MCAGNTMTDHIPQRHPRPKQTKYFWTRRTNDELTLTIIQRQRNRILETHKVYHDDRETTLSSLNQKDTPLGQQEPNMKGCSTQRTSYKRTQQNSMALIYGQPQRRSEE